MPLVNTRSPAGHTDTASYDTHAPLSTAPLFHMRHSLEHSRILPATSIVLYFYYMKLRRFGFVTTHFRLLLVALAVTAVGVAIGLGRMARADDGRWSELLDRYNVDMSNGTFTTRSGVSVPYRMCKSRDLTTDYRYPAVLFAPGLEVHLDRWTPDCIRWASEGYIVVMKGRLGENYGQWEEEVEAVMDGLQNSAHVDDSRIAMIAESFGGQETQSYALHHPSEVAAYVGISTYNSPEVMRDALYDFDIPTALFSGGGETPPFHQDCDLDGLTWTSALADKFRSENPDYFRYHQIYDEETYGCVTHGFMWQFGTPAEVATMEAIIEFLDAEVGREPIVF